jgi:hypothetical protein
MFLDSLWRSKWRRRRYERKTTRQIERLRKQKQFHDANQLSEEMRDALIMWQQYIWAQRTTLLVTAAKRLDIPVSYDKELWRTNEAQDTYLTAHAQHELHKAIRQEKDDRLTHRMKLAKEVVIPIVTFILGLITAYITMRRNH